jgi:peptide/nickel transport system ATP-binding protein
VANPHKKSEPVALEGELPSPANPPKGCKFHTRCKYCTDKCREEAPASYEVSPGHFVACHLCAPEES